MVDNLFVSSLNPTPPTTSRRPRKGALIGAGQVGMACAYSMLIQSTFDEMVLVDSEG
jgi:L-lactate dehydrogenase